MRVLICHFLKCWIQGTDCGLTSPWTGFGSCVRRSNKTLAVSTTVNLTSGNSHDGIDLKVSPLCIC